MGRAIVGDERRIGRGRITEVVDLRIAEINIEQFFVSNDRNLPLPAIGERLRPTRFERTSRTV